MVARKKEVIIVLLASFSFTYLLQQLLNLLLICSDFLHNFELTTDGLTLYDFFITFFSLSIALDIFTILNGGQLGDYDDFEDLHDDDWLNDYPAYTMHGFDNDDYYE